MYWEWLKKGPMVVVKDDGYDKPVVAVHVSNVAAIDETLAGCQDQYGDVKRFCYTPKPREVEPPSIGQEGEKPARPCSGVSVVEVVSSASADGHLAYGPSGVGSTELCCLFFVEEGPFPDKGAESLDVVPTVGGLKVSPFDHVEVSAYRCPSTVPTEPETEDPAGSQEMDHRRVTFPAVGFVKQQLGCPLLGGASGRG
jgi:hypothetical protein